MPQTQTRSGLRAPYPRDAAESSLHTGRPRSVARHRPSVAHDTEPTWGTRRIRRQFFSQSMVPWTAREGMAGALHLRRGRPRRDDVDS